MPDQDWSGARTAKLMELAVADTGGDLPHHNLMWARVWQAHLVQLKTL